MFLCGQERLRQDAGVPTFELLPVGSIVSKRFIDSSIHRLIVCQRAADLINSRSGHKIGVTVGVVVTVGCFEMQSDNGKYWEE